MFKIVFLMRDYNLLDVMSACFSNVESIKLNEFSVGFMPGLKGGMHKIFTLMPHIACLGIVE